MSELFQFIEISLKFVLNDPNGNKLTLVQVMAWCRTGNKPLSESMMTRLNDASPVAPFTNMV